MEEIIVKSRPNAAKFTSEEPWAAISICTHKGEWPQLHEENRAGLLQLAFFDCSNPNLISICAPEAMFQAEQAEQILDFALLHWGQIKTLLVHCEAGLSRSPGVAAALTRLFIDKEQANRWFKTHFPNSLVYSTILRVFHEKNKYRWVFPEQEISPEEMVARDANERIYDEPWDPTS